MRLLPVIATPFQYVLHATWALFLSFNVFFNYYHCAFTHPGKPEKFLPSSCVSDSDDEMTEDDEEAGKSRYRFGPAPQRCRMHVVG